ncbi:MAG: hypothetical protein LC789_06025 [Actinobacteria bacterium]|nr:hypothetical protein [Actinomycetota bacterium]
MRVRPATADDLPELLAFGEQLRDQLLPAPDSKRSRGGTRSGLEARYQDAIDDPDRNLVLAIGEADVPLGMALFTVAPANALLDLPALHVSHVVVAAPVAVIRRRLQASEPAPADSVVRRRPRRSPRLRSGAAALPLGPASPER